MMMKKYDFQDEAVDWLFEKTLDPASKKTIVLNAPTGSGKTVILIKYIDRLLAVKRNIAVVWLCPGKGDLEEQSRGSFDYFLPSRQSFDLNDALTSGFEAGSTSFINWDKVTKKDNKAITENEKDNLYDKIKIAHNSGIEFLIIVDEEHSNNTAKANDLLRYFDAIHTVRVSATTVTSTDVEYKEVDEEAVIGEGLITEAISVNEGVVMNSAQDDAILLELADAKRKEIQKAYKDLGKRINPLVLIQFPNGEPDKIKAVEEKLAKLQYTRENGMVAAWLSGDNFSHTEKSRKAHFTRVTEVVGSCQMCWNFNGMQHICNKYATNISMICIGHFQSNLGMSFLRVTTSGAADSEYIEMMLASIEIYLLDDIAR